MSGENQVTRPELDSSVSAEVMRLGFEAARQTVGDQARASAHHRALSFSDHPVHQQRRS